MADEEQDKQHEPSQKKLEDARKKGDLPRSNDLSGAIAFAGILLVLAITGSRLVVHFGDLGVGIFSQLGHASSTRASAGMPLQASGLGLALGAGIAPLLIAPGILVLMSLIAQRSLVFAPEKLKPKLSRISPLANARNRFGRNGLFEFAKSLLKLTVVSLLLAGFLASRFDHIAVSMTWTPEGVSRLLTDMALEFLVLVTVSFGVIGGIDVLWQRAEHHRRNRMSHKELKDEMKESEGDPHMKMARRRRAQEIALNTMLSDVAEASVVIVNPEHYAVALKWDISFAGPPVCVAKGVDEIAARIREAAIAAGVPIHRDPPTARAIHAATEIGQEINPDQYRAVAAAIRFAEKMRDLVRKRVID